MLRSLPTLMHQGLQAQPSVPILRQRAGEIGAGPIEARGPLRCSPLVVDRGAWTPEQQEAAAAVLGDEAADLLRLIAMLAHPERSDMAQGMDAECGRIALRLATEAWHYATRALEARAVDAMTLGGVCR